MIKSKKKGEKRRVGGMRECRKATTAKINLFSLVSILKMHHCSIVLIRKMYRYSQVCVKKIRNSLASDLDIFSLNKLKKMSKFKSHLR